MYDHCCPCLWRSWSVGDVGSGGGNVNDNGTGGGGDGGGSGGKGKGGKGEGRGGSAGVSDSGNGGYGGKSGGAVWGGVGGGGGGSGITAKVRARYDVHLPALYLRDGEKSHTILAGTVTPTVHGQVLFNNWHLCGLCWEDCKRKNSRIPTSPDVAETLTGMLRTDRGGCRSRLQPSGGSTNYPLKPSSSLNLSHQGECGQQMGETEKRQFNGKNYLLLRLV